MLTVPSMGEPRAFVTGWPIAHSRSPLIHNGWLAELSIAGAYERVAVEPQAFPAFLAGLRAAGYAGGNVTIPHKEAAFAGVQYRNGAAEAIGAVNTLWFEGETLVGGNTDAYGFSANLDERLPGWRDGSTAVVLGAGGAARAIVHALREAGFARIAIVNRTPSRAIALAQSFSADVGGYDETALDGLLASADLLVNTRPPSADDSALDLDRLPPHAGVTDIVYVPLATPLLTAAAARGLRTADGLGMLLHQAVPGFERWFGIRPSVTEDLRARVLADIANG